MTNEKLDIIDNKILVPMDMETLRSISMIGLKDVDLSKIDPDEMFLMQSNSSFDDFKDGSGNTPKVGQFFMKGPDIILDTVDCNIIKISDGTYINQRKPELGPLPMKIVVAASRNNTLFAIRCKSTAEKSPNSVISKAVAQKLPLFVFNVTIESKKITGKENSWYVPVFRVTGQEEDMEYLAKLADVAASMENRKIDLASEEEQSDSHVETVETVEKEESDNIENIPF